MRFNDSFFFDSQQTRRMDAEKKSSLQIKCTNECNPIPFLRRPVLSNVLVGSPLVSV